MRLSNQRHKKRSLALKRLQKGEKEKVDYLHLLVSTGIALSETDDFDKFLEVFTQAALNIAECEACSIYETDGDVLRFLKTRNVILEKIYTRETDSVLSKITVPINISTIAGYTAVSRKILNIPDVYSLDPQAPYSFNPSFDKLVGYQSRSMLAIPMCDSKGNVMGVLQLINRREENEIAAFPEHIESYLRALASQFGTALKNWRMQVALKNAQIETVKKFVKASEYHDSDTGSHIERMSRYSALLYRALGYNEQACEVIRLAAMLHDVGKISIPDAIMKKPGKLTAEEFDHMKRHTVYGYEMLAEADSPFLKMGAIIAYTHHEKWDGSGYPNALKGKDIPLEGRIVALADVFDALCSSRCYKDSWPVEKVLDLIRESSGSHFDPELVDLMMTHIDAILEIRSEFPIDEPEELKSAS